MIPNVSGSVRHPRTACGELSQRLTQSWGAYPNHSGRSAHFAQERQTHCSARAMTSHSPFCPRMTTNSRTASPVSAMEIFPVKPSKPSSDAM